MTGLRALRNRLLDSRTARTVSDRLFGIDSHQYRLLIDIFASLADNMEFMGTRVTLGRAAAGNVLLSLIASLPVLLRPALHNFLLGIMGLNVFFLLLILLQDAANSLLNPDEASVLAHLPIRGATYVAAKLTHIFFLLSLVVLSLNIAPALAGLYLAESRWFYPFTHLMAAFLAGLFMAFLVCGVYGWLFRFVAPARLKNVALWLPLLAFLVPMILVRIVELLSYSGARAGSMVASAVGSSWLPLQWFVSVGLVGHASGHHISASQAAAACAASLALITFGLRSFRADFLVKASTLIQGSAHPQRHARRRYWLCWFVRALTGSPSGRGGFTFSSVMLRRDWSFRRQAFPNMVFYFLAIVAFMVKGIRVTPFVLKHSSLSDFSLSHLFPHSIGILLILACCSLPYTAEPQGTSMFLSIPLGRLRPFVRGVYLSLWIPLIGVTHLCLLGPCVFFWGPVQGVLFVCFSAALTSLYLSLSFLAVEGFPFFRPSDASAAQQTATFAMIIGLPSAILLGGIQWLLFHSVPLVAAAVPVLMILSYIVGRASIAKVERDIRKDLRLLELGPQQLFKEVKASMFG